MKKDYSIFKRKKNFERQRLIRETGLKIFYVQRKKNTKDKGDTHKKVI